jgi:uncharacterized Zn finger protein (UPF0148 family)
MFSETRHAACGLIGCRAGTAAMDAFTERTAKGPTMIVFHCPHCDRSITLEDRSLTRVACPHCQQEVAVPEFEQEPTRSEFPIPTPEQLADRSS